MELGTASSVQWAESDPAEVVEEFGAAWSGPKVVGGVVGFVEEFGIVSSGPTVGGGVVGFVEEFGIVSSGPRFGDDSGEVVNGLGAVGFGSRVDAGAAGVVEEFGTAGPGTSPNPPDSCSVRETPDAARLWWDADDGTPIEASLAGVMTSVCPLASEGVEVDASGEGSLSASGDARGCGVGAAAG
ncbi:MAG: hypothetical protein AAGF11_16065 [Myxococcota bacterium]